MIQWARQVRRNLRDDGFSGRVRRERTNSLRRVTTKPAIRRQPEVRRRQSPKGDLRRAIAGREIEVKVQLNQLAANPSLLVAGQALAWRSLTSLNDTRPSPTGTPWPRLYQ